MIKNNKGKAAVSTALLLLPVLAGLLLWNRLPERIPIHWNASGEMDGWGGRAMAVFVIPGFMLALHWLCLLFTSLDPKVRGQSGKVLGLIFWICPAISLPLTSMLYAAALGREVNIAIFSSVLCGMLFIVIGNYLPKCKRNYTIGIKVMWTLDSEENWNATHRFAGKVCVAGGFIVIICAFLPAEANIWVTLLSACLMTALSVGYSFIYYKKHG